MKKFNLLRYCLWGVVLVAAGLFLGWTRTETPSKPVASDISPAFRPGAYSLINQRGEAIGEGTFLGKPSAFFFGFTFCPNICPVTLANMTELMKKLEADVDKLNVVFVSVDPERDTYTHLAEYLKPFDHRIMGLTGTPDQISQMAEAFGIYYKKVPLEGGDYTMDHTASTLLFDAQGVFQETIDFEENSESALKKLKLLIEGSKT